MEFIRPVLETKGKFNEEQWAYFKSLARPMSFAKGEVLQSAGDVWEDMYFIESGLLRVYYLKDGTEYIRQFFFERGVFCELASAATKQASPLYMDAVEAGKAHRIAWKDVARIPPFQFVSLQNSLYHITRRMESIFLVSPEERYLELVASRPKVMERIPQYMIASYLGVTPEGLSRLKRRLKKDGLL